MAAFDSIAQHYDSEFTRSETGRLQRAAVYRFLKKIFKINSFEHVLELNCGTGEDALFFAKHGIDVMATDISSAMINIAETKAQQYGFTNLISTEVCAAQDITSIEHLHEYDLVFSNFGGLNCLSPVDLKLVSQQLAKITTHDAYFIAVIMPRFCLWETIYFLLKGQVAKAFRRNSKKPIMAKLNSQISVETWYYSPQEFAQLFQNEFTIIEKSGVGIFLPPSYLDGLFNKIPMGIKVLNKLDKLSSRFSFFANLSDHVLIVMKRK